MIKVDAHQHFWQLARGDYSWISPSMSVLYRDYLPADIIPLIKQENISKTVLVQAAPTFEETKFIVGLANQFDFIAGVVGWVDMAEPCGIEQLKEISIENKLLGIRPVIQDIEDKDWILKPELDVIFQYLIAHDLTFDALIKPIHISNLITIVDRYPELKVVVDHGAKPNIIKSEFSPWAENMAQLAQRPQVYCKLSGLLTEAPAGSDETTLSAYVKHLFSTFGASRLMWGSDWPVVNLASDYANWHRIAQLLCRDLTVGEAEAVFGGSAIKFYDL